MPEHPGLAELGERLIDCMPRLGADDQRLALALYRRLSEGSPVTAAALAAGLGRDEREVAAKLEQWPGVYRDERGRVVGFWGLAIGEMPHRLRLDGRQLHTWCAWDALFIPELLGETAQVESRSPASGLPVRLTVGPDRVLAVEPEGIVVSMLTPTQLFDQRVVMSFCHYVHFFPSAEDAGPWLAEHKDTFLLSIDEAFELGQMTNRVRFAELGRGA